MGIKIASDASHHIGRPAADMCGPRGEVGSSAPWPLSDPTGDRPGPDALPASAREPRPPPDATGFAPTAWSYRLPSAKATVEPMSSLTLTMVRTPRYWTFRYWTLGCWTFRDDPRARYEGSVWTGPPGSSRRGGAGSRAFGEEDGPLFVVCRGSARVDRRRRHSSGCNMHPVVAGVTTHLLLTRAPVIRAGTWVDGRGRLWSWPPMVGAANASPSIASRTRRGAGRHAMAAAARREWEMSTRMCGNRWIFAIEISGAASLAFARCRTGAYLSSADRRDPVALVIHPEKMQHELEELGTPSSHPHDHGRQHSIELPPASNGRRRAST